TRGGEEERVLAARWRGAGETPLWVENGPGGRIRRAGGAWGDAATAGIYAVSERARARTPPETLGRLREYLGWLCEAGEPLRAVSIGRAVDVDRPEDVRLAESLLAETAARPGGVA